MKVFFRKLHRWLGLLMALQIVAWMGSGLYFSVFPIEEIRGEHLTLSAKKPAAGDLAGLLSPAEAWASFHEHQEGRARLAGMSLHAGLGQTWYKIRGSVGDSAVTRLVDARTGEVMPFLSGEQAAEAAAQRLAEPAEIIGVELVENASAGSEFRGRALPVWRVSFEGPENLNLYIDGWTGEIVARRTDKWRLFDFLWMLHIMDFDTRDDFNTPLLQVAAALGLVVALSGVIFWLMTTRLLRARKPSLPESTSL